MPEISLCRSCRAPIRWERTPNGKRIPLDPEPVPSGNIVINEIGLAVVVKPGQGKYQSHFVSCPNAARHRTPKGG